jgi:hypothetical protein
MLFAPPKRRVNPLLSNTLQSIEGQEDAVSQKCSSGEFISEFEPHRSCVLQLRVGERAERSDTASRRLPRRGEQREANERLPWVNTGGNQTPTGFRQRRVPHVGAELRWSSRFAHCTQGSPRYARSTLGFGTQPPWGSNSLFPCYYPIPSARPGLLLTTFASDARLL